MRKRFLAFVILLAASALFAFKTGKISVAIAGSDGSPLARSLAKELRTRGFDVAPPGERADYLVEIAGARSRAAAVASIGFPIGRDAGVDATVVASEAVAHIRLIEGEEREVAQFDVFSRGFGVAPSIGAGSRYLFVEIFGPLYERSRHQAIARNAATKIAKAIRGE